MQISKKKVHNGSSNEQHTLTESQITSLIAKATSNKEFSDPNKSQRSTTRYPRRKNSKMSENTSTIINPQLKTNSKRFKCIFCSKNCASFFELRKHARIHKDNRPFQCSQCEYKCARRDNLKNHMKVHRDEKPFTCKKCNFKCKQSGILSRHFTRFHTRK